MLTTGGRPPLSTETKIGERGREEMERIRGQYGD